MLDTGTGQLESVEVHRLQALAETQRKHIEELNKQLHECLEVKMQQQLQLVEQSPARRNVRQLLARAAADNTALAKKVEELRAQRNALAVTKAALTGQMSELIRGAADDVQREVQHKTLLTQLQQLYHLTGQRGANQPATQMAAVFAFLQKAAQRHQALLAELQVLKHTPAQNAQPPPLTALADAPITHSPTDQQLDKNATSQLIWWDGSCTELGRAAAAAAVDNTPFTADIAAAAANDTGDVTYKTGRSYFSDMSSMSPLKGSSSRVEGTPSSKTPNTAEGLYDDGLGSPLSCQSLSQLSSSEATPAADIAPRRLNLEATPVSKYISTCDTSSASCSSNSSDTFATPPAVIKGLDHATDQSKGDSNICSVDLACSPSPLMLMSPVFGFEPHDLLQQTLDVGSVCNGRDSAAAAAARPAVSKRTGGLQLEPEFRLAACESVWPSPALVASADDCGSDSSLSHAVWLAQADFRSPPLSRVLDADLSSPDAGNLMSGPAENGQRPCRRSKRRRALIIGMLVIAPVTIGAVAGGATAWHFNQQEARQLFAALQRRLQLVAVQAHGAAAAGLRRGQQGLVATCTRAKQLARQCCTSRGGKSSASHQEFANSGPGSGSAEE